MIQSVQRGEQGRQLYAFLERLQPDEGATLEGMADYLDTTTGRVAQLLAKIRQGRLPLPHQRAGQTFPPLNIYFDRMTERYYNLGTPNAESIRSGGPGEVLKTWAEDLVTRSKSFGRVFETQVDAGDQMDSDHDALSLLNQLPHDQVLDLFTIVSDLAHQQQRARKIIRERRRQAS